MSGSRRLDRVLNVKIGVEFQIFVFVIFFLTVAEFYNFGYIEVILRVH